LRFLCFLLFCLLQAFLFSTPALSDIHGEVQVELEGEQEKGEKANMESPELQLRLDFRKEDKFRFFTNLNVEEEEFFTEEAFLSVETPLGTVKAGKFRLPFGIYNRSEQDYMGILQKPVVKGETSMPFHLAKEDAGILLSGGSPKLGYETALMNSQGDALNGIESGLKDFSLHLQTYAEPLILGVNIYRGSFLTPIHSVPVRQKARVEGLDWRISFPYLILRGEFISGEQESGTVDLNVRGYYQDAFYHFPTIPELTGILRVEAIRRTSPSSEGNIRQVILGAKYFLRPSLTLSINASRKIRGGEKDVSLQAQILYILPF